MTILNLFALVPANPANRRSDSIMNLCRRHDCAYDGECEACKWESNAKEYEADLELVRNALIKIEKYNASLEQQLAISEDRNNHLESIISSLEADLGM